MTRRQASTLGQECPTNTFNNSSHLLFLISSSVTVCCCYTMPFYILFLLLPSAQYLLRIYVNCIMETSCKYRCVYNDILITSQVDWWSFTFCFKVFILVFFHPIYIILYQLLHGVAKVLYILWIVTSNFSSHINEK